MNEKETIRIGNVTLTLDEAEETLAAIREGKIDAVVVEGVGGNEIYTFRDPSHPFRLLVEALGEGAVLATFDGTISYQNPCFSRMIGMDAGPSTALSLTDVVVPEHREVLAALLERARNGPAVRGNVELIGAGGRPVPVQVSVSRAILVDTGVFCIVVTDLTEQRRQEELYRTARTEIEARDRLLSVVAHELRNPLGVLEMQAHLLGSQIETTSTGVPKETALTMVSRLRAQGRRLGELVNTLLDVGSIGSGRLRLSREEMDLSDVVKGVVDRAAPQIAASGSAVTLELHAVRGHWDRIRIEQVVDNLLSNAIKYGAGRPVRISVSRGAFAVRLSVEDRGPGIPGEAQERIFRPFERAGDPTAAPGLGIGLFVTAEIVKAHGGTIRVQTRPSGGSRFVVELPLDS